MSYSAAVASGTVRRYSICYVVRNSSRVTLGQNLIYKVENVDRVLPLVNYYFFFRKLLHFLLSGDVIPHKL